jgi:sulfide:quinone oxidoreductase
MSGHVVIVGSGFAGLSAALELSRHLSATETVTVISASPHFVFLPSLIWVTQGWREIEDISFPVEPVLTQAGIKFIHARLEHLNPHHKTLTLNDGQVISFDKLLITTGGEWAWDSLPGLSPKPQGQIVSILSLHDALNARYYWQDLMANPGPVVIGLAPGASLYGAAYEFALNLDVALRKEKIRDQVDITFITPEPFLGHFGHGGLGNSRAMLEGAFAHADIQWLTKAEVTQVDEAGVTLADHRRVATKFTMLVPTYRGIKPVRDVPGLADGEGRIPVDSYYRSLRFPSVFAAGVAMQVKPVVETLFPCGVFVPGVVSADMGRKAAANIAADLWLGQLVQKSVELDAFVYILDSGAQGLFISLGPQAWVNLQLNLPGPWSHWAKVIAEKYQMWQIQAGKY